MNTINTQELINFLLQQQHVEKTIEINTGLNIYFDYLRLHNRAGTLKSYKTCFKPLLEYLTDHKIFNTHQITDDVIMSYVLSRKPFVKNQTINKEVCTLKFMLNFLIKKKYIDKMNFTYDKLPETKTIIEQVKKEDINLIINYFQTSKITDKYKLIFLLILTTGIRTTELINIKNSNIHLKEKRIYLDFTKSKKERNIYIMDELIPLIRNVMNNNIYLFNNDDNNCQLTDNAVRCFFKHLKRDLDIDVLSPHKLRHYFATNVYKKSLDIYLVSNLLGHTNTKTTEIYLDIDNKANQKKACYYNPLNDLDPLTH